MVSGFALGQQGHLARVERQPVVHGVQGDVEGQPFGYPAFAG